MPSHDHVTSATAVAQLLFEVRHISTNSDCHVSSDCAETRGKSSWDAIGLHLVITCAHFVTISREPCDLILSKSCTQLKCSFEMSGEVSVGVSSHFVHLLILPLCDRSESRTPGSHTDCEYQLTTGSSRMPGVCESTQPGTELATEHPDPPERTRPITPPPVAGQTVSCACCQEGLYSCTFIR
jgi:hypothetical protein